MTEVRLNWLVAGAMTALLLAGCGGGSTTPDPANRPQLAGGGRGASSDAPKGGGENSGPQSPAFAPAPAFIPVFYADRNCFSGPFTELLTNQTALQTWWTTAISCQPRYGAKTPPPTNSSEPGSGSGSSGGGTIEPGDDYYWDPFPAEAPQIDFSKYAVAAIGIENLPSWGRGIWVTNVVSTADGTTITYEVSSPGDDCYFPAVEMDPTAPSIAVMVPADLTTPVTFERTDTTWNCTWEPDPSEPWTVYYTDADCNLGPNESLLTTKAAWEQWLDAAYDCDLERWNDPGWMEPNGPSTGVGGGSSPGNPGPDQDYEDYPKENPVTDPNVDPRPPSPESWGLDVNFDTHAILILRAGPQIRWGGGIWLNAVTEGNSGTNIEYTVMQPAGDCPSADGYTLRPTVAIRIPKPSGAVSYTRHIERLSCDWGEDDVLPMPAPGNSGTRPG